jgi:general nucleoside transport system ATP-binding protein
MSATPSSRSLPPATEPPPSLEVDSLSKTFGSFRALDRVSLRVAPGTVHALLGENGAGKSTLVKCVMGYHRPDDGCVRLSGREASPRNPREAQRLGIGMVYQHFTLVPNMTACENLVLARARLPLVIDWRREQESLAAFLERTPFRIELSALVHSLTAGERQKLEILKQLYKGSRIMILDEPTSVLTPAEADEVLTMLHGMAKAGEISVILITHKFREVTRYADEVTILRRGRAAGHGRVNELTTEAMAAMMMGRAPGFEAPARATKVLAAAPRLKLVDVEADDDTGVPAVRGVRLEIGAGEIVGVAAIAGNGQEELVEVLAGQRPKRAGQVNVGGRDFVPTRRALEELRLRCLPEEPLRNACVPTMSVAENLSFRVFDRKSHTRFRWFISAKKTSATARRLVAEYAIVTRSVDAPIALLSGGNVQRTVLARELEGEVDVLIAANPCMGLDFAATAEIHGRIRKVRDRGAAVLLVSADLDELLALADRIVVMSEGRIAFETTAAAARPAELGRYMGGHLDQSAADGTEHAQEAPDASSTLGGVSDGRALSEATSNPAIRL